MKEQRLPKEALRTPDVEHKLTMDANLVRLVRQIAAATPEELERKLELLSKAGTLAEVERKLGFLSAFDANLLKLLRRIPAKTHQELEEKIASLIPKKDRAPAIAQEKEGSWRGYNSYLVNLARRIPAVTPVELEGKIASLIPQKARLRNSVSYPVQVGRPILFAPLQERNKKVKRLIPNSAVATDASDVQRERKLALSGRLTSSAGAFLAFAENLLKSLRRIPAKRLVNSLMPTSRRANALASRNETQRAGGPIAAEPMPDISTPAIVSARPDTGRRSDEPAPPSAPRPAANDLALKSIPAQPLFTQPEDLAVFGPRCERVDKVELAAAARRMIGGAVDLSFPRFIDWLRSEGYVFGGFEDGPPRFDERCAYLRYDVHQADLLAAYVLADLHERLGIVGSFQITWKFSRDQEEAEPYFAKLLEFDRRFVQFGLHAAPTATWYLYEKLGIDSPVEGIVDGDDFSDWILDLHAAYCRDGDDAPGLREIRQGTDDTLSRLATSFRATFGEWKSISGHGNFLTKGFNKVGERHPEVDMLLPYFYPEAYLAKWGLMRFGFDHEITWFGSDGLPYPRVLFEGNPAETRRKWYRGRVAHGAGFVALLHPATWTSRENATFFLPEEEASAALGDAGSATRPDSTTPETPGWPGPRISNVV